MEKNYKSELVGVLGHPVAENPTIIMLEAAFKAKNLDWRYLTVEVMPEDIQAAVSGIRAMNFQGVNLTIPHKIEVMNHLDAIAPDAALIGAVNTVRREKEKLIGENTDGKGFLESLKKDAGINPDGKNFHILGAGGAARAVSVELALAGALSITISNRTRSTAEALVEHIRMKTNSNCSVLPWTKGLAISKTTDVLVNATSIGLYPHIDDKPDIDYKSLTKSMTVCDVVPNPPETAFLKEAAKQGCTTINGLGMLVYQGAIGFKMWTGLVAPVTVMKEALAREFLT